MATEGALKAWYPVTTVYSSRPPRMGSMLSSVSRTQNTTYNTKMAAMPEWKPAAVISLPPDGSPCIAQGRDKIEQD